MEFNFHIYSQGNSTILFYNVSVSHSNVQRVLVFKRNLKVSRIAFEVPHQHLKCFARSDVACLAWSFRKPAWTLESTSREPSYARTKCPEPLSIMEIRSGSDEVASAGGCAKHLKSLGDIGREVGTGRTRSRKELNNSWGAQNDRPAVG